MSIGILTIISFLFTLFSVVCAVKVLGKDFHLNKGSEEKNFLKSLDKHVILIILANFSFLVFVISLGMILWKLAFN